MTYSSSVNISTYLKNYFSKTTGPFSIKFHMRRPGTEGEKVYIFGPGHMTKIAAMPIYVKNLKKNLLLRNHLADCLETLYVANGS